MDGPNERPDAKVQFTTAAYPEAIRKLGTRAGFIELWREVVRVIATDKYAPTIKIEEDTAGLRALWQAATDGLVIDSYITDSIGDEENKTARSSWPCIQVAFHNESMTEKKARSVIGRLRYDAFVTLRRKCDDAQKYDGRVVVPFPSYFRLYAKLPNKDRFFIREFAGEKFLEAWGTIDFWDFEKAIRDDEETEAAVATAGKE
ncbi:Uu.00g127910.m01.CDS01 [Anthostomella pinea]|uniref:Uu.00g127910.m01.CDS01 n=1 Tax=Anthostomella pinea TaxID=933095 RepID=A0AAI8VI95_9PEZI|nr:Uu.00g127910.m01.CDS01 [Anthostomella pinea]